jgi:twitching motility two-component system response regulator PilG
VLYFHSLLYYSSIAPTARSSLSLLFRQGGVNRLFFVAAKNAAVGSAGIANTLSKNGAMSPGHNRKCPHIVGQDCPQMWVWVKEGSSDMEPNFQDLKVMVIDDSKTIRRTAETLLKKVGCDVITATDGFDALAKIADTKPDIIFVDIMMPRLDGYQTCALIKNNSEFKSTPVIMLSSKDGLFDKAKGRIVGSDQYLTKPFSKNELLGAIQAHVANAH